MKNSKNFILYPLYIPNSYNGEHKMQYSGMHLIGSQGIRPSFTVP